MRRRKSGRLASPESIVDAIEKGMRKRQLIIYPGESSLALSVTCHSPKAVVEDGHAF